MGRQDLRTEDNFTKKFSIYKPNLIAIVSRFLSVRFLFFLIRRELSHYQFLGCQPAGTKHKSKVTGHCFTNTDSILNIHKYFL